MDSLFIQQRLKSEESDDKLAFETLFNNTYTNLVFFSFNLVKNKREAEDIAQDAFIKYWHHRQDVAGDQDAVKSFLYTSVKNASLNLLRHQKVIRKFEDQLPELVEEKNIIHTIIQSEVYSKIHRALGSLPAGCRQIAGMSYLDDKKNTEIAEELGISVNTVKTQKQRAMQLLRQKFMAELFSAFILFFLR
jgi:RNA polymerase sigma-70 factor (family 1)